MHWRNPKLKSLNSMPESTYVRQLGGAGVARGSGPPLGPKQDPPFLRVDLSWTPALLKNTASVCITGTDSQNLIEKCI